MKRLIYSALLVLALVAAALAASNEPGYGGGFLAQGYPTDSQTAAFRTAVGVADAVSVATLTSTTTGILGVRNRQTIAVSARFVSSGATAKVRILYEYGTGMAPTSYIPTAETPYELGIEQTLTATSFTDAAGKFMSNVALFDAAGATHARVVVTTGPATNNMDLWVGTR